MTDMSAAVAAPLSALKPAALAAPTPAQTANRAAIHKTAQSFESQFMSNMLLSFVHFPAHAIQGTVPWPIIRDLALIFLPVYAGMVALSLFVLFFYRIDKATHERNLATMREAAAIAETGILMEAEAGVTPSGPIAPIVS